MKDLLLHSSTRGQLDDFLARPRHAVLITGHAGSGKGTVARQLAAQLLGMEGVEQLDAYPYLRHLSDPDNSWPIDTIRALSEFLRLRTTGAELIRRIIILEQAQYLTTEAQNAFLKLLEEPPADTVILLTATSTYDLLPTITSRTQHLAVEPVSLPEVLEFLKDKPYASVDIERSYHMSGGGVGLMTALLEGDDSHPLAMSIQEAKTLLQATAFERLTRIDNLTKQKADLLQLVRSVRRVASAALLQAASKDNSTAVKRWHTAILEAYAAEQALARNAQPKLVLSKLFLHL